MKTINPGQLGCIGYTSVTNNSTDDNSDHGYITIKSITYFTYQLSDKISVVTFNMCMKCPYDSDEQTLYDQLLPIVSARVLANINEFKVTRY